MPNRVVHPPTVPIRRDSVEECTVVVDNLVRLQPDAQ